MAELRLQGVAKRFGPTRALAGLDLSVADGEFVVLLGPTGAGKTTTLRVVAGVERPDAGTVMIGGTDVTGWAPADRDVAFVFQQYSLYPHYTVFENLAFPLRSPLRRRDEADIRRRVHSIAEMLRIEDKLKNRATRLSGGEMQRVAIGRALVREPQLFLMDEPLSSLDAKLRESLRVELKRIQNDLGATILYVTHDQIEAMTLADRIGVLAAGALLQVGTPREVYAAPASVEVARRLGSPPINLLPADRLPLRELPAGTVRLGVRPEDVVVGATGIETTIKFVEHLGAETIVVMDAGGVEIRALVSGERRLEPGTAARVAVDPRAVLFFDSTDRRLAA